MKRFPLSTAILTAAFALAPLSAATAQASNQDYRCSALPDQVRSAVAESTDRSAKARAERFLATGNSLCNARAEGAAARQYRSALRVLGASENQPQGANAIAGTNNGTAGN